MRIPRFAFITLLLLSNLWIMAMSLAQAAGFSAVPASEGLSLEEVLTHAARNRQELKSIRADLDAAAIKLKHAGLPPNPELGLEWDNLGGNLPTDDVRETVVSLRQTIETGGKPSARRLKAKAEASWLQQEQTTVWLDIAAETRMAYLEILGGRERLVLQQEAEQIASELADITRERVAAGELAATEETRAEARRAETRAETQKLKRLLAEAELNLAAILAEPDNVTVTVAGILPQEVSIPDREMVLTGMEASPLLALRRSEAQLASSGLALEQSNAWADPSLSLALREIPGKDGRAVSVGLSIPLPFFQRNQSALAEAGAMERKATTNHAATERRLRTELIKAHTVLVATDQEARTLRTEVLSRTNEAAESVLEGFRVGKFRYSDVLEASQSQMTAKARYLDAILDLNRAAISLDRLLGKPAIPEGANNSTVSSLDRSKP